MSFKAYAEKVLYEEAVSSKLTKNAIDILNDYIYYVKADLSNDERKQIVDSLEVAIDSVEGTSVTIIGTANFVKNAKYNKKVSFSVELVYNGLQDSDSDGDESSDQPDMDMDVDSGDDVDLDAPEDLDAEEVPEEK